MALTVTLNNFQQSSFVPVIVLPVPLAKPEDLIWNVGPTAPTLAGPAGAIYGSIIADNVIPAAWYHGGRPLINQNDISFQGCGIIQATYTKKSVVSGTRNKGLNEMRLGLTQVIQQITGGATTIISAAPHNLNTHDIIKISGTTGTLVPTDGYFLVNVVNATSFTLIGATSPGGIMVNIGSFQKMDYLWDEVYTTPLGLFDAVPDGSTLAAYEFLFTSDNSNEIKFTVTDPNIVPQVGDHICIQRYHSAQTPPFANFYTTDGLNNVKNYLTSETYVFKMTNVTSATGTGFIEYTVILDKSFAPIISNPTKYMMVLLNRTGIGVNKELYSDTWHPYEVHREQLLGDPYNYTGSLQPKGRKNYLYYEGSKFLGVATLLKDILENKKTPIVILDWDDEIKDRINFTLNDIEIHLPNIMLQDEKVPVVLTNNNAAGNPSTYFTEQAGVNKYAPLYLMNAKNKTKRYGWVFFDLRIFVIDDAELATAMGYATKRDFTLPKPKTPLIGNTLKNSGPTTALSISNATNTNPVVITTSAPHNFVSGDQVVLTGILGNNSANSPANLYYYAQVLTATTFRLYQDLALTIPVVGSGNYIAGTGNCYSRKLPYEYFMTYRLKGPHYKTLPYADVIPFNFESSGAINNISGQLQVDIDVLTHLVDTNVLYGFEADEWELIIGKYVPLINNPYTIDTIDDVVYLEPQATLLKTAGVQNVAHSILTTKAAYTAAIGTYDYDIIANDPIWNLLSLIPDTMYVSEGKWLLGNMIYKEHAEQYRMTFTFSAPQNKWNGTTNPTFVPGDPFMTSKLITEMGFFVSEPDDSNNALNQPPYIYGKISPVVKKDNSSQLNFEVSIDF